MNTIQDRLNSKAVNITWNEIKNTHIDNIKQYLHLVIEKPEFYLQSNSIISKKNTLSTNEFLEIELLINKYFSDYLAEIKLDLTKNRKNQEKKKNKKKKGLSKEEIIIRNIKKKVCENKFSHKLSNLLYNFYLCENKNLCDLIKLCQELYKFNLINLANKLLKSFCKLDNISDLDEILYNLDIWKKENNNSDFQLTHCQKSIISFLLNVFKKNKNYNSILEMSNTGSGKTVGIILAIALIWKNILYNKCISYIYTTHGTRKHSVKFPTQMVIAVLPSSVISFVQSALTSLNIPWSYVTPLTNATIYEFDPTLVINYSHNNRNKIKHFKGFAPAIYLTTETPSLNESILLCIKSYYKNVYSHIEKQTGKNLNKYISYDNNSNKLNYGKKGLQYSKFHKDWVYSLIGDDIELITPFTQTRNLISDEILTIITTATPTGLSKKIKDNNLVLPKNIYIPSPQDEVRNCSGVCLIGEKDNINILMIAYLKLFKLFDKNDKYIAYKWYMVLYSYMYGIFERKYIIPYLEIICNKLNTKVKNKILNREMFFDGTLELNIDSICCHIIKKLCLILRSEKSKYIVKILNNLEFNENKLFSMECLKDKINKSKKRGIILCSPTFMELKNYKNNEYINSISNESFTDIEIYNKLQEYCINLEKYENNINSCKEKYKKNKIIDDSKHNINQLLHEEIDEIKKPIFDEKYQIFSKKYFNELKLDDAEFIKTNIDELQFKSAYLQNDIKLAQGILSINPNNSKKLDSYLKLYTHGNENNIRLIQFLTNIFNTRQLILGANPPTKLNIIIANYDISIENEYAIIKSNDGIIKYPINSVNNLLIQICGRISRGVNSDAGFIYTTNSVANILITNTPKYILYNQLIKNNNKVKYLKNIL